MKASNTANGIRALVSSLHEWLFCEVESPFQRRAIARSVQPAQVQQGSVAEWRPSTLKAGSGVTWP